MQTSGAGRVGIGTGTALLCLLLLSSPQSAAQRIEGLVNIEFEPDVRVFAVTAAMNIAGFNLDAGQPERNPGRRLLRDRLRSVDAELLERLRSFYRSRSRGGDDLKQQGSYVSLALLVQGPPQFRPAVDAAEWPEDVRALSGFEDLVAELWREAELSRTWAELLPHYLELAESHRPVIRTMILETLQFLRTEPRVALDRRMILIPDLLNAYGVVNARNVGRDYLVVVGPARGETPPIKAIRHEYLHFLLDPLVTKYLGYLPEDSEPFLSRVRDIPDAPTHLRESFPLVVTESFIYMVESRLDRREPADDVLLEGYDRGLVLAPYMGEALSRFERGTGSIYGFIPDLISGIAWKAEKDRDAFVQGLRERATRERTPAESPEDTRLSDLLRSANERLLRRQFEEAGRLLEQALEMDPDNASALFGMAQIAGQAQDFDRALDLYGAAAARAGGQSWIAGWARVRRGNILLIQGEREAAEEEWRKVEKLPGDLRGAREAAARALAEIGPAQAPP